METYEGLSASLECTTFTDYSKLFGWQTFKRVGASMTINRVYKLVLILSITIQLSLFFMVVTVGLWIDQLWNGQIAHLAKLAFVYKPVFIIVLVVSFCISITYIFLLTLPKQLLIPWLMTVISTNSYPWHQTAY